MLKNKFTLVLLMLLVHGTESLQHCSWGRFTGERATHHHFQRGSIFTWVETSILCCCTHFGPAQWVAGIHLLKYMCDTHSTSPTLFILVYIYLFTRSLPYIFRSFCFHTLLSSLFLTSIWGYCLTLRSYSVSTTLYTIVLFTSSHHAHTIYRTQKRP